MFQVPSFDSIFTHKKVGAKTFIFYSFGLQLSLTSATSFESRCGPQIFASTGYFRGNLVRIKEIKFSKKKDVNREMMKEMRLLRDIRHDNVNSFIGAVVEPMRILVVTDYCSKGSLYVSVDCAAFYNIFSSAINLDSDPP